MFVFGRVKKARVPRPSREAKSLAFSNAVSVDIGKGIKTFKKEIPSRAVEEAFATNNFDGIYRSIPWDDLPDHLDDFADGVGDALADSAESTVSVMAANIRPGLRYDTSNPRVSRYLDRRAGLLITNIGVDSRENIARVIRRSFDVRVTPRRAAMQVRNSIGLLPQHEIAVNNYLNGLLGSGVRESIADGRASDYANRLLDYRANMIARSEIQRARNEGQMSVWHDASDQGLIDPQVAKKVWVVDGNPCEICAPMSGVAVGLNDSWQLPDGRLVMIPADSHPMCLCDMSLDYGSGPREDEL